MASQPGPAPTHPLTPEQEERRHQVLLAYQRSFAWFAALALSVAVVGVIVAMVALQGPTQAVVIAVCGGGGVLAAWMCLLIRKRIGTGPKGTAARWPLNRVDPPS
jgi:acetyl esterase/lipase